MENITITKTFTYTDSLENILFWATNKGYRAKIEKTDEAGNRLFPMVLIDNPQSVKEFCEDYIVQAITTEMTAPIKAEVLRQSVMQANKLAKAKEAEVISKLIVE